MHSRFRHLWVVCVTLYSCFVYESTLVEPCFSRWRAVVNHGDTRLANKFRSIYGLGDDDGLSSFID